MKKIFNLAVIFAALMTAVSFASCDDDDKADDETQEQQLPEVSVKPGDKFAYSNADNAVAGWIKCISATGTAGSKVVELEIATKKSDAKGQTFTLGDDKDHTSYLMYDGTAYTNVKQTEAEKNASKIIFCLKSDTDSYLITSATVNNGVKNAGATETKFAVKK